MLDKNRAFFGRLPSLILSVVLPDSRNQSNKVVRIVRVER